MIAIDPNRSIPLLRFMRILLKIAPEFVAELYNENHHLNPKKLKLAKIFIRYILCGSFSEEIYNDLWDFRVSIS